MRADFPNLFILGVAKAGTTTLADALRQHPDIYITHLKEVIFFSGDNNYTKGMDWYVSTFFHDSSRFLYRGEATPSYMYFARKVASRMKSDLPDENIKFIVVFRNPVDRAYSHYWQNFSRTRQETLPFEDALRAEPARLENQSAQLNQLGLVRFAYFDAGLYAAQLKIFWEYFPRGNFLLLLHEDLSRAKFGDTMVQAQRFLGVNPIDVGYRQSNPSGKPRVQRLERLIRRRSVAKEWIKPFMPLDERSRLKSLLLAFNTKRVQYPPMRPSTREMLIKKYASSIKEFEAIIERDLSAWLR